MKRPYALELWAVDEPRGVVLNCLPSSILDNQDMSD